MNMLKKLWPVLTQSGGLAVYKILKNRLKRQLMKEKHLVLKYNKTTDARVMNAEITYKSYTVLNDISENTKQQFYRLSGRTSADEIFALFEKKAVFWAIFHQKNIVGYWWSISMENLKNWYIPLEVQDLVFFAAWVAPVWRGHAIAPSVLLDIIKHQTSDEISIYLDVETWNESGIKAWKKAGFIEIGLYPPLSNTQKV